MLVLLLNGAYLWKFHQHHAPILGQAALAAIAAGLALLLVLRWNNVGKLPESLKWIIVAQLVAQVLGLFRSW